MRVVMQLIFVVLVLRGVFIFEKVVVLVVVLDTLRTLEVVVREVIQEYRRLAES